MSGVHNQDRRICPLEVLRKLADDDCEMASWVQRPPWRC